MNNSLNNSPAQEVVTTSPEHEVQAAVKKSRTAKKTTVSNVGTVGNEQNQLNQSSQDKVSKIKSTRPRRTKAERLNAFDAPTSELSGGLIDSLQLQKPVDTMVDVAIDDTLQISAIHTGEQTQTPIDTLLLIEGEEESTGHIQSEFKIPLGRTKLKSFDTQARLEFDPILMPKLQKVLADAGIGSRRDMEVLIDSGRVTVNNEIAHTGQRVLAQDIIKVNNKLVHRKHTNKPPRVVLYHKPSGEIVSHSDPDGRVSVFEKMPRLRNGKWLSVGRLDYNTEGLLIMTNSGDLANRMMHPRFGLEREYAVRILGELTDAIQEQLKQGIQLEDGIAKFLELSDLGGDGANKWYKVVLTEGKNREIRRMFEAVGMTVSRLIRTRFGPVYLPSRLKRGQLDELDDATSAALMVELGAWKDHEADTAPEQGQPDSRQKGYKGGAKGPNASIAGNEGSQRRQRSSFKQRGPRQLPSYPSQQRAGNAANHDVLSDDYQPSSYGGALYTPGHAVAGHVELTAHSWNLNANQAAGQPVKKYRGADVDPVRRRGSKPANKQSADKSNVAKHTQSLNSDAALNSGRSKTRRKPKSINPMTTSLGLQSEGGASFARRNPKAGYAAGGARKQGAALGMSRVDRLTGGARSSRPQEQTKPPAQTVTVTRKRSKSALIVE